jgi:hypothetical protein
VFGWKLATLEEMYPKDSRRLNLKIRGVDFVTNLIGLDSKGLDVIHGIGLVKKAQGTH